MNCYDQNENIKKVLSQTCQPIIYRVQDYEKRYQALKFNKEANK